MTRVAEITTTILPASPWDIS